MFWTLPPEQARELLREVVREVRVHRFTDEDRDELGLPVGRFVEWAGYVDVVWR